MQLRGVGRAATVAYMALILCLALAPAPDGPQIPHLDKLIHMVLWGAMAGLFLVGWPGRARWALIVCALHGAATEVMQGTLVLGRSAEWLDWVADVIGAGVVVGLAVWAQSRRGDATPVA